MPIPWHVIRICMARELHGFLLLTGYLGEANEEFVSTTTWPDPVEVECLDTGLDTPTGGRIWLAADHLADGPLALTYADWWRTSTSRLWVRFIADRADSPL